MLIRANKHIDDVGMLRRMPARVVICVAYARGGIGATTESTCQSATAIHIESIAKAEGCKCERCRRSN